jgi:hypothetical protein
LVRAVGTTSIGIRAPIIRSGDDIVKFVCDAVFYTGITLQENDVVGVTESVVARSQGNIVSVDNVAEEINAKFSGHRLAVVYPILSRNRFSNILKGIARGCSNIYLILSYPSDEVGNHLMHEGRAYDNDMQESYSELEYIATFEENERRHPFTGIDYVSFYKEIIEAEGASATIVLTNNPLDALKYTKNILVASIHNREWLKQVFVEEDATVLTLSDLCNQPTDTHGYNETYGLLGSNLAGEEKLKLFPRDCMTVVQSIQAQLMSTYHLNNLHVLVYGDGAYKDPLSKVWELADPVTAPGYTPGLELTPNELKLKYIADADFGGLTSDQAEDAIKQKIKQKETSLVGKFESQGTTPRRYYDLLASLCDLTSGSGDKGTPIVIVRDYFKNFAVES